MIVREHMRVSLTNATMTLTIHGVDAGRDGRLTLVAGIVLAAAGVVRICLGRPWLVVFPIQLLAASFAGVVAVMNIVEFFLRFSGYSSPSLPWAYFDLHAGLWVLAAGALMGAYSVFTDPVSTARRTSERVAT